MKERVSVSVRVRRTLKLPSMKLPLTAAERGEPLLFRGDGQSRRRSCLGLGFGFGLVRLGIG